MVQDGKSQERFLLDSDNCPYLVWGYFVSGFMCSPCWMQDLPFLVSAFG